LREVTPAQRARLGIFLLVAGGTLIVLLGIITGGKLLERRDTYYIRYRDVSVSGLDVGSQVKYHGVRIGRVDRIAIDPKEVETVVVTISVDHGTPITSDVKAVISALSLTGIKVIELTGGTSAAKVLPVNSEITPAQSTFDLISGKAEAVSEKLELVLTNLATLTGGENQQRLMALIDNTTVILSDVHEILIDNSPRISNAVQNFEYASERLAAVAGSPAIDRVIANLDTTTSEIRGARIGDAVSDLRLALQQARTTLTHIDLTILKGRHDILTSLEVLRESLDSFNEFARTISEDPSLLLRGTRSGEVSGPVRGR